MTDPATSNHGVRAAGQRPPVVRPLPDAARGRGAQQQADPRPHHVDATGAARLVAARRVAGEALTGDAPLLAAMIEQMGGAPTSAVRGAFLNLSA